MKMETQNSESISGHTEAYWPRLFPHQPWPLRKPRLPPYWPLVRPLLPLSCRLPWSVNPKVFLKPRRCWWACCLLATDWELSIPRVYAQSFFLAQKSNQNTWFSLPWIFPWIFVGFLLSSSQSFLRKPSFLVLADFFFLVF
jgi:hypothetical protein